MVIRGDKNPGLNHSGARWYTQQIDLVIAELTGAPTFKMFDAEPGLVILDCQQLVVSQATGLTAAALDIGFDDGGGGAIGTVVVDGGTALLATAGRYSIDSGDLTMAPPNAVAPAGTREVRGAFNFTGTATNNLTVFVSLLLARMSTPVV